jgi:sugar phosphate isomerase/epimerase
VSTDRLTIGHYMLRRWTIEDDVRNLERLGFASISLASTKLRAYGERRALRLIRASGLKVAHVGSYGHFGLDRTSQRRGVDEVRRAIGWAHEAGADVLVCISGGRGRAPWEQAATVYRDAYAALVPEAGAAGLRLAVEVLHPLLQHLGFVSTLADGLALARAAGPRGGYVLDVWHSGWEPRLLDVVARDARRRIHAVQLSDVKPVTLRTADRALLGKGTLPLADVVAALERGGYRGWYEAEIISDDVEALGYERVLRHTRRAFRGLLESV